VTCLFEEDDNRSAIKSIRYQRKRKGNQRECYRYLKISDISRSGTRCLFFKTASCNILSAYSVLRQPTVLIQFETNARLQTPMMKTIPGISHGGIVAGVFPMLYTATSGLDVVQDRRTTFGCSSLQRFGRKNFESLQLVQRYPIRKQLLARVLQSLIDMPCNAIKAPSLHQNLYIRITEIPRPFRR
jgi:hypothetical protein